MSTTGPMRPPRCCRSRWGALLSTAHGRALEASAGAGGPRDPARSDDHAVAGARLGQTCSPACSSRSAIRSRPTPIPLDPAHPDWGNSPYVALNAERARCAWPSLLTHLFVLIPVLDNAKHYYVGEDEVEKLLRKGEGWLEAHPERELIVRRYLRGFGALVRLARSRSSTSASRPRSRTSTPRAIAQEEALEKPIRLNDQRMERVVALLRELGAQRARPRLRRRPAAARAAQGAGAGEDHRRRGRAARARARPATACGSTRCPT